MAARPRFPVGVLAACAVLCAAAPSRPAQGPRVDPRAVRARPPALAETRLRPPSEAEIDELLRGWPLFEEALDELHELSRAQAARPGDLARVEEVWTADARVRQAFAASGGSPERFLELYRRTVEAWWALSERETRRSLADSLRREIRSLHSARGPEALEVRRDLERGLARLAEEDARDELDLRGVTARRAALAEIFSPGS